MYKDRAEGIKVSVLCKMPITSYFMLIISKFEPIHKLLHLSVAAIFIECFAQF